jgi:hypothetical protein
MFFITSLIPLQTNLYQIERSLSDSWRARSKTRRGFDVASVTASQPWANYRVLTGGANLLDLKYFHHMPSDNLHHSETSSSTVATCSTCSQVMSYLITTVSPCCQSLTPFTHEQPLIATFTTNPWPPHHPSVCFGHRHLPPHPKWPVVHLLEVNIPIILLTVSPASD